VLTACWLVQLQAEDAGEGLSGMDRLDSPAQHPSTSDIQVAEVQRQLEAARHAVADLRARNAAAARLRDNALEQLAAERAHNAALRAEEQRVAAGHKELQEAWKGMVDDLKEQLKVRGRASIRSQQGLVCAHFHGLPN
jgi:chromosome segregation ATPase